MEKEEEALELLIVHNADIFWNGISPSPPLFAKLSFKFFAKDRVIKNYIKVSGLLLNLKYF
jgi:hypothetical protein